MITVEELIIQSLYHRMVVVNVRRTYSVTSRGGRIDALALLISGAQRMRTTMGAQEQAARNQGSATPQQGGPVSPPEDGASADPEAEGSVVQIKSREGTLDFGEDVQTILDTGEIKLVKATQRTTGEMETQTDFAPMWFFGFDPTTKRTPATVTTPDGTVVSVPEESDVHSIPAVDLSRFEQFSVIHYSDTRDPENRKLVMVQTPGSKMHRPEDLCTEDMSVQNKPMLNVPSTRRQLLDRKSKSLDNSALTRQTTFTVNHQQHENKPLRHDNVLKRQERIVDGKIESVGEAMLSRDGDLLQDPDIDSGIWDMVHGRDVRLNSGDAMASPSIHMTSAPSTSKEQSDRKEDLSQDDEAHIEEASVEAGTWQEMYQQMSVLERPTMSYRVFHIQDQVTSNTLECGEVEEDEEPRLESPMLDQSDSPQPLEASTPHDKVQKLYRVEQLATDHAEHLTERIEELVDQHAECSSGELSESLREDTVPGTASRGQFRDGIFLPVMETEEGKLDVEDSGWLFDKIPAMQGSLIHSPVSPSSPNPFPPLAPATDCNTHENHDIDLRPVVSVEARFNVSEDDVTPTEELCVVGQPTVLLEGQSVATTHPELPSRGSQESTDTVTEECSEDRMSLLDKQTTMANASLPTSLISEESDLSLSMTVSELTSSDTSKFYHILFDEQEDLVGAPDPQGEAAEELSIELSQCSTTNGDIYVSCDEGNEDDMHVSMEMVVKETVLTETVTITTTTSTPESSNPGSQQGSVMGSPVRKMPAASVDHMGRHRTRKSQLSPLQSPVTPSSSSLLQSYPLFKPSSPRPSVYGSTGGDGEALSPEAHGCVVHRSGARPKLRAATARCGPPLTASNIGLGSLFSDDPIGTLINGQKRALQEPDDVYLVNRDGTLTNANSGVVYRSGARPMSTPSGSELGDHSGLHGLNSLMVRSTSSNVVHTHLVTELTAARARLKLPELRRTPDRHSVASSDSEYTSHDSSLATSPTSTSVEELASVGSDTCLLTEVMPVACYSDWMSTLPKRLHAVPLTKLAIPGQASFLSELI